MVTKKLIQAAPQKNLHINVSKEEDHAGLRKIYLDHPGRTLWKEGVGKGLFSDFTSKTEMTYFL